jgi:hypothetical protein
MNLTNFPTSIILFPYENVAHTRHYTSMEHFMKDALQIPLTAVTLLRINSVNRLQFVNALQTVNSLHHRVVLP